MAPTLSPGADAPPFEAKDHTGTVRRLADYADRGLVLYLYPYDGNRRSRVELRDLQDHADAFAEAGIAVLGVSTGDAAGTAEVVEEESLDFPLLVDPDDEIAKAYGAYTAWKTAHVDERVAVLVDGDGIIRETWRIQAAVPLAERVLAKAHELGVASTSEPV